jgi:hypothetical protein
MDRGYFRQPAAAGAELADLRALQSAAAALIAGPQPLPSGQRRTELVLAAAACRSETRSVAATVSKSPMPSLASRELSFCRVPADATGKLGFRHHLPMNVLVGAADPFRAAAPLRFQVEGLSTFLMNF